MPPPLRRGRLVRAPPSTAGEAASHAAWRARRDQRRSPSRGVVASVATSEHRDRDRRCPGCSLSTSTARRAVCRGHGLRDATAVMSGRGLPRQASRTDCTSTLRVTARRRPGGSARESTPAAAAATSSRRLQYTRTVAATAGGTPSPRSPTPPSGCSIFSSPLRRRRSASVDRFRLARRPPRMGVRRLKASQTICSVPRPERGTRPCTGRLVAPDASLPPEN